MGGMVTIEQLIELVEAEKLPSNRKLDLLLDMEFFPDTGKWDADGSLLQFAYWHRDHGNLYTPFKAETCKSPRYTDDLSATSLLIPVGWFWMIGIGAMSWGEHPEKSGPVAYLWRDNPRRVVVAHASTPILALCSAILKARNSNGQ